jgi:hypothetical protein
MSGGSHCSQSDLRLHFGLGAAKTVEKVEILWPSGRHETVSITGVDRELILVEGSGRGASPFPARRP